MTNTIIVTPTIVNEIEFYVSNDGKLTGMSPSGLARLCGVAPQTLRQRLLANLSQEKQAAWNCPECLELFRGNVYYTQLVTSNGSVNADKIVKSDACAAIIEYYAFDSKAANDTARNTYRKFAKLGIDSWIKELTGFANEDNYTALLESMQTLISEVRELKVKTDELNNIRKVTTTIYPGMDACLDDFAQGKALSAYDEQPVTLVEWLSTKGITLNKPMLHKFANLVAETYRTMKQQEPSKRGTNGNTRNVFYSCDFPLLDVALNKMMF